MLVVNPRSRASRILLVDDTELNRELVAAILVAAGFVVDVAADGASAWEATWSKSYDLVLMDLEMPGMSGFEAAARIRAREGVMSGVPIAALTATAEPNAEQFSLWSGIDEFIAKPVEPRQLIARVDAILADRHADGDDWKPVWRLHVFADWTRDKGAAADYLDDFGALLENAADAIHVHATDSDRFLRTVANLRDLAVRYGFDEIAGVCALYANRMANVRSRDPNLLGAIGRAVYAIKAYRHDRVVSQLQPLKARSRVSVASLFGGRHAA